MKFFLSLLIRFTSLLSSLGASYLIATRMGLEFLGLLAFIQSIGILLSLPLRSALPSIFLREAIKHSGPNAQKNSELKKVVSVIEVLPKVLFGLLYIPIAMVAYISDLANLSEIFFWLFYVAALTSIKLSSSKYRYYIGELSSQCVQAFPAYLMLALTLWSVLSNVKLEPIELATFPTTLVALAAWFHLLGRTKKHFSLKIAKTEFSGYLLQLRKEYLSITFVGSIQLIMNKSDIIICNLVLGEYYTGALRLITQLISGLNSSVFVIKSYYIRAYATELINKNLRNGNDIEKRARFMSLISYFSFLTLAVLGAFIFPEYFERLVSDTKIFFATVVYIFIGSVRAAFPILDQGLIYSEKIHHVLSRSLVSVFLNLTLSILLSLIIGLPGVGIATLASILFWKFSVKSVMAR